MIPANTVSISTPTKILAIASTAAISLVIWILAVSAPRSLTAGSPLEATPANECVVLIHGLGRTYRSMRDMEKALQGAGYTTFNIDYPSRKHTIEHLAEQVIPAGADGCRRQGAEVIHFVTHSMGGILLRYYLERHEIPGLGRVVMLSPPNNGSEVADELRDVGLYAWINGPAGQQLGTGDDSLPRSLGPVGYPVGVITGDESTVVDAWFSRRIPGEDDGKVSVRSARVEGMADFLVVHHTHTFIVSEDDVIAQALHFLRHGRFEHGD